LTYSLNVYYTENASSLGKRIFETIRQTADEFIAEVGADYHVNTE